MRKRLPFATKLIGATAPRGTKHLLILKFYQELTRLKRSNLPNVTIAKEVRVQPEKKSVS